MLIHIIATRLTIRAIIKIFHNLFILYIFIWLLSFRFFNLLFLLHWFIDSLLKLLLWKVLLQASQHLSLILDGLSLLFLILLNCSTFYLLGNFIYRLILNLLCCSFLCSFDILSLILLLIIFNQCMLFWNNHCTFWLLNLQILLFWLSFFINLNCLSIDFLVLNLFWIWFVNIGRSVPQANIDFSGTTSLYLILFLLGWCVCVGRLTRLIHIRILINWIRSLNMFCVSFGQMFRLIGGYQATVLTLEWDFRIDSWLGRFDIDFCYF